MAVEPDAVPASAAGSLACLHLLEALRTRGLRRLVLCPGSRSAPLAVAAWLLEPRGLTLHTAMDERSAAFFALGLARGGDRPVAVVTTSGSAVANLLPALVEADQGTIPLVLLTADRPERLKGCGANQTVNQEAFLAPCCRWVGQGPPGGLATMAPEDLERLALRAMAAATGQGADPPGPVHLNLPLEEPLHPDGAALEWLRGWEGLPGADATPPAATAPPPGSWGEVGLDPDQPGVVVAGPWRGSFGAWADHCGALARWQRRTGWPVLADALSGLRGRLDGPLVASYDLVLQAPLEALEAPQVLRLGPLPASRRLQAWLERQQGCQVLVSEGDPRPLDPLRRVQGQWSGGLAHWPGLARASSGAPPLGALELGRRWLAADQRGQALLRATLDSEERASAGGAISEPWLARRLGQLLPPQLAVMLANSSPVRDWESFGDPAAPGRPVVSFRGASGIDGTLSIACGLAEELNELVLICGDLALQHDSNGWLWRPQLGGRLLVVVIDNGGGGIFEQLPIRPAAGEALDFERLFAMPQAVDPRALAAAHGVPSREVARREALEDALRWGLEQPVALLRVVSDRRADAALRHQLRTMAAELNARP
ncbi:MAG: 2-succinyl-5-enolpyruvyl-6-hydroxy-3-cyclohexene-1-carboxylic-acid synthase [Cyanobacteriota bacterium]|nr:2-succinyl-5-enolpyruvyl-6-hydroxy-3-cyclohexene-1-carboxylic-acid synthase [Cyanobacteriota bacterium]